MPDVLVVLTHWKRTANLLIQLDAFAAQTVPVDIVVVDNGQTQLHEMRGLNGSLLDDVSRLCDNVYSIRDNAGLSCRFVAPMMDLRHKWCLLQEGFGYSMAEAMLAGVPVVAAPCGIAEDARVCTQVPIDATPSNWVTAIRTALDSPAASQLDFAREFVLSEHSPANIRHIWESVIQCQSRY